MNYQDGCFIECRCKACGAHFRLEMALVRNGHKLCPICEVPDSLVKTERNLNRRIRNE